MMGRLARMLARGAMIVASGGMGFAAVAAALGAVLPAPYGYQATPKLRHIEQHRGDYELLFCGSSRVLRHFMAQEFDAQLAAAGHRVRSFNFGVDAMPPPESFYVLRQALALRPRVRWVLIELWDIRSVATPANLEQKRFVNWHDVRHTLLVLRRLFVDGRVAPGEKLARTAIHLRAAFTRCSHIGRGSELATPLLQDDPKAKKKKAAFEEPTPWLARAGFNPGPPEVFPGPKRAEFEAAVRAIRESFPPSLLPPTLREQAAQLVREVRAIGAEPVFVVMPTVHGSENFEDIRSQGVDAPLLSLVSPRRFPELYETRLHNDDWHLTEEGARIFTRDLAGEFRALLDAKK